MTVRQVAEQLGVSRQHIYEMINEGQLTAYKVGAAIRLRLSDVEAALQRIGA
jgi:excisionase family DNA binding protein